MIVPSDPSIAALNKCLSTTTRNRNSMMKNTVLGDRLQQAKPKRHGRVSRSGVGPPTKACRGYCRGYPSVKHTIEPALYLVESNPPLLRRISGHHKAIPCGSLCEHQTGRTHLALFGRHFWLPCFKLLYSIRCAAMAEFLGADASGRFRKLPNRGSPGWSGSVGMGAGLFDQSHDYILFILLFMGNSVL